MLFIATVVGKLNTPTIGSKLKILSTTSKYFSSSTGYSEEELEKFRKVFRTQPSYKESIASKDHTGFLNSIGYVKPQETYDKYTEFIDKVFSGRIEWTQLMKYLRTQHDPSQIMNELAIAFDKNNDGFITKDEFEYGMEMLKRHDPRVKNFSYEAFVKEADVNNDGKISVLELKDWLANNLRLK